jgi:hypothetical protein
MIEHKHTSILIKAGDRFFQHRFNLQVFSIKPEVIQMKKPAGFLKTQVFSKNLAI